MRNVITSQLVRHNRPRIATVRSQQSGKEAPGCLSIAFLLHEYINDFSILIDGTPQIMLFPVDLDKDLIKIERITEPQVPTLQAPGVSWAELVAPEPDRLITDDDASLRQQVFDVTMT
ncbi:MAG: hypothetical protein WBD34_19095, partial [Burkholderiaceae bacterium]